MLDDEDAVTKTALQTLFAAASVKDRYYPLPSMKNVENVREESKFFTWDDDERDFLKQGAKQFKGHIKVEDGGPALVKKLQAWRGAEFGAFLIDEDGNFIYRTSDGTLVQPLHIAGGSFDVRWIEPAAEAVGMVEVSWNWHPDLNDGELRYITKENLDFDGLSYTDVFGLYDVDITTSSPSTTALTVAIVTDYNVPVTGLALTDMRLYNTTDSAEVTITSATESTTTPGTYVLAFAAEGAGDELLFNLLAASGYDPADTATATIPGGG
jgi:hypothetical protein